MSSRCRILVPLGASPKDLKSVHYALALAERIRAQIFVLQEGDGGQVNGASKTYLSEALLELINGARQAGLVVSHHVTGDDLTGEIIALANNENIELVVFGAGDWDSARVLAEIKPFVASKIIQVRGKDRVDRL